MPVIVPVVLKIHGSPLCFHHQTVEIPSVLLSALQVLCKVRGTESPLTHARTRDHEKKVQDFQQWLVMLGAQCEMPARGWIFTQSAEHTPTKNQASLGCLKLSIQNH